MRTDNLNRGVFASRDFVREIGRNTGVRVAVKKFLANIPKRPREYLVVMCTSTNDTYWSKRRDVSCLTLLASLWQGGDRFKLFTKKQSGELQEVPVAPLLAIKQPTRNPKG